MVKRTAACLALGSVLAAFGPPARLHGEVPREGRQERPKFSALQKSLLVPGWGQFDRKKYLEGGFFLSLEIFYLIDVFRNNRKGNDAYRLYKSADNTEDAMRFRELTERYDRSRNIALLAAAGVWAVNLIDMSWIIKRQGKVKSRLDIKANVLPDQGLSVRTSYRF